MAWFRCIGTGSEPTVYDRNIVITEVSTTAGSAKIKLSYYEEKTLKDEIVVEAANVSGSANALNYQNMIKVYMDSNEWVVVALNAVECNNLAYILNDEILRWSYANTGINYNIAKLTDYEERLTYDFLGYTDSSPVTFEKVIDANIESFSINNNSFISNTGSRQGCYKEVTKAKIALYIKDSSSGSYVQVADADYTLTTTQNSSNNYSYDISYNADRYIYAVKVVFTDVYRVGGEILYKTKDELPPAKKSNDISLVDSYYVVDSSAASTKTSKSFTVISGDTVLLAVMRRANVTPPTGFELIAESDAPLDGYQTLSIYKKVFDSNYTGTFQIINETSTSRCSLMVIQLRGSVTTSILTKLASNASGSYTYTLPTFEGPCIFFCQNAYADSNAYSWDFGSKFYTNDYNNVSSKVYLSEFMQNNGPSSRLDMIAYLGDKKVNGKTITCSQSFSEIIGISLAPDN